MRNVIRDENRNISKLYLCHIKGFPAYGVKDEVETIIETPITEDMVGAMNKDKFINLSLDHINNIIHAWEFKYEILKANGYEFNLFFDVDSVIASMKKPKG